MKNLNKKHKRRLKKFAGVLQEDILAQLADPRIRRTDTRPFETDTRGWASRVISLSGMAGGLELWFDLFPNIGRPVLSLCCTSTKFDWVAEVAKAFTHHQRSRPDLSLTDMGPRIDGHQLLASPLKPDYFDLPLLERYQASFFTVYLSGEIRTNSAVRSVLTARVVSLAVRLTAAMAAVTKNGKDEDGRIEGRLAPHLRRERSRSLARDAKIRDGFICGVCGFNFVEKYGEIGRGFAEAHHRVPLSKLRRGSRTRVEDLVTVCANCHRMLHRQGPDKMSIKALRKVVAKCGGR